MVWKYCVNRGGDVEKNEAAIGEKYILLNMFTAGGSYARLSCK